MARLTKGAELEIRAEGHGRPKPTVRHDDASVGQLEFPVERMLVRPP